MKIVAKIEEVSNYIIELIFEAPGILKIRKPDYLYMEFRRPKPKDLNFTKSRNQQYRKIPERLSFKRLMRNCRSKCLIYKD